MDTVIETSCGKQPPGKKAAPLASNDSTGSLLQVMPEDETGDLSKNSATKKATSKTPLALIDARHLARISFSKLIEITARDFVIYTFSEPSELLNELPDAFPESGVIIFSIGAREAPEDMVCHHLRQFKGALPGVPVVVLSDREDIYCVIEALRHGAKGYIPTTLAPSVLVSAVRLVNAGGMFVPAEMLLRALDGQTLSEPAHLVKQNPINGTEEGRPEGFTPRQWSVLQLLKQGKSNKVIAYELKMEESTVKVHVRNIMKHLKVTNRTHAAILAHQMDTH